MRKKLLSWFIAAALCLNFLGCSAKGGADDITFSSAAEHPITEAVAAVKSTSAGATASQTAILQKLSDAMLTEKNYIPKAGNVKLLGRTYLHGDTLWLAHSATGVEFTFTGTRAVINLKGDNIAIAGLSEKKFCRYAIYVNDQLVVDELLKEPKKTITVFESDREETVTIRIVKLSEASCSTMGIGKIHVIASTPLQPTPVKAHSIEFIGDSITCGFGVDGKSKKEQFSTATEDATKTYAYKTAQALKADCSIVSFSGYGIISGYTKSGTQNIAQLVPNYYSKMGVSNGYFNSTIPVSSLDWDFNQFIPELVVINLGTNDNSYCKGDAAKEEEYVNGYVAFLKQIREKNPKAVLLCTLGMMGDALYPSVERAVSDYKEETGDSQIYSMKFEVQSAADGYGASRHPSRKTHTKAAIKLTREIKEIMGW